MTVDQQRAEEIKPIIATVFLAKSTTLKSVDSDLTGGLHELKEVIEHKNVRGTKGFLYKCVWNNAEHEPTWEPESNIKPTADKLLNLYWRSATKSSKTEPT